VNSTSRLVTVVGAISIVLSVVGCAPSTPRFDTKDLRTEVIETERAFARTMAGRDHAAFQTFLSKEAVFFSGEKPLRGADEIAARWKRFYESPDAPFSWEPEKVEVLDSGTLALSSGPVRDPKGELIGTFTSIWKREGPGKWRIVFDKGNDVCPGKP
jgi:ketosteroid isomerase-like protein